MTTFIWNTEYEVLVAVEETVRAARQSLVTQINKELNFYLKTLNDQQDKLSKDNVYYEGTMFDSWIAAAQRKADEKLDKVKKDPDQEILFYECVIYQHANE